MVLSDVFVLMVGFALSFRVFRLYIQTRALDFVGTYTINTREVRVYENIQHSVHEIYVTDEHDRRVPPFVFSGWKH